jgi:hypothetical protein
MPAAFASLANSAFQFENPAPVDPHWAACAADPQAEITKATHASPRSDFISWSPVKICLTIARQIYSGNTQEIPKLSKILISSDMQL